MKLFLWMSRRIFKNSVFFQIEMTSIYIFSCPICGEILETKLKI